MRTLLLFIMFSFATTTVAVSQEVSKDYKADLGFYAAVIDSQFKTAGAHFPKQLYINGTMLTYVGEFLEEKTLASGLKKYILENGWDFLKDIDTTGYRKLYAQININDLKPLLDRQTRLSPKSTEVQFRLSPVIFLKDRTKAFLVLHKSENGQIFEVMTYFFEQKNGKWKLVKTMEPYLI